MTASYTSRLRLVKQGDGDNPNTWGTVLNDGMISLVDDAIAGYTTVSLGSAATVTLSAVDGGGDVPRSAFLELKGSVGGANNTISMIIPAQSKSYVINNKVSANTTASDVVKLKTASSDGHTIPFGSIGLVTCDGTSVYSTNAKGLGLGTAASADVGVCANNVPEVSAADLRYVRTSVTTDATVRGNITYEAGSLKIGTSARAYNPITTLTDAASITSDFAKGNNFLVTIGANRTLAAPSGTSPAAGQFVALTVIQDGTGSRTLTWNATYEFKDDTAPTLTTTAAKGDLFVFKYNGSKWLEVGRNQNLTLS